MNTSRIASALVILLTLVWATTAFGLPVTLSYTADNEVVNAWLIHGTDVELITLGPNADNWRIADTYALGDLVAGDTYEIIWQTKNAEPPGLPAGADNPGGFLGQVAFGDGTTLFSSSSWEVALLGEELQTGGPVDFDSLGWVAATEYKTTSDPTTIWYKYNNQGPVGGIDENAYWIWWENNYGDVPPPDSNDSIFIRTTFDAPVPTPEPGTMFLLGSGLIGLAAFRKRMK